MKILKWLGIIIGGLVLLLVIGIGILTATFDPNKYKGEITSVVKEKKNRTLAIPGDLKLAVFPKLGVELGALTLSEFKSEKEFVKLEGAKVYLEIMPLLNKEIVVDKVEVSGLNANVVRTKDGKFNFDDLLSKDDKEPSKVKFDISSVKIANSGVSFRDDLAGNTVSISALNLATGRVADKVPTKVNLSATIASAKPAANIKANVIGELLFDLEKKAYSFSGLDAQLSGSAKQAAQKGIAGFDLDGLESKVSASILKFDQASMALVAEKLALDAKGSLDKEPFEVKLSAPKLDVNAKTMAIAAEKLALEAKARRGQESGSVKLEAAKIVADMGSHKLSVDGLTASGSGAMPGMLINDFKAKAPKLAINLEAGQIIVDGVALSASGKRGDDGFDIKVDAPKLNVSKESASGEAITGTVKLTGKESLDAKFNLSGVKGSGKSLSIGEVKLDANAKQGERTVVALLSTALTANLEAKVFEFAKINADVTVTDPKIPQKTVKLPITGSARADLAKQTVTADIATRFDESAIQAKVGMNKFQNGAITFDVAIDRLNLDKYLPPKNPNAPKTSEPEQPIDLSGLKALNASGTVKIGSLQVNNIKASNVSLTIRAAGGKVDVSPMSAALYQGSLAGAVSVNANTNAFAIKQNLTGININPLMKDAINKDILEGRGNINLDVTTTGATPSALKKALNGTTAINLRDGAYKGINLAKSFREAKAALSLNKDKVQDARKEDKTDFTEMKISAVIKNGVATSNDLDAKSPFVRLGGAGTVDIGQSTMDYVAKATVVGTPAGQDAKDFAQLKGVAVPVKVYGPLDAVKYDIQYGAIAGSLVTEKAKSAVEDKLKGALGIKVPGQPAQPAAPAAGGQQPAKQPSAEDKAKEKLRGLFGR
jgi:AsmA protein